MATAAAYSGRLSGHETFVCRYAWLPKIVLELDHSLDLPLLINHKAKAETSVGSSLQAWAEVTFERQSAGGTERITLRRGLEGSRRGPYRWVVGDVSGIRGALGLFLHEDQWKEAEIAAAAIRDDLGMAA